MEAPQIILHVDLDAFFAAVEILQNPELKGKPVIVGADLKIGRGIVNTASYEAREFGVRSGMPISRAYRLCPQGIFIQPNFELYEKVSEKVMKIIRKHAVKFEQTSIDEAYLDVTGKVKDFEEARELAEKIKKEVFEKMKLSCSIGVGPNKLIAKIATEAKKPFGTTVVKPEEVKNFLKDLPVRRLLGIGPKTAEKLKELGITTIGQIALANSALLVKHFGVWGAEMHRHANGIDDSPVLEFVEPKSIGRETTFVEDTDDVDLIIKKIDSLAEETHKQLVAEKYTFRTVTVKIRYEDFETHTHAKTLQSETDKLDVIKNVAKKLVANSLEKNRKVRLIGVRVSHLVEKTKKQKTLAEIRV